MTEHETFAFVLVMVSMIVVISVNSTLRDIKNFTGK